MNTIQVKFNSKGLAQVRNNGSKGKVIARVYDRAVFFKGTRYERAFAHPYSLELTSLNMSRECDTVAECEFYLNKYATN